MNNLKQAVQRQYYAEHKANESYEKSRLGKQDRAGYYEQYSTCQRNHAHPLKVLERVGGQAIHNGNHAGQDQDDAQRLDKNLRCSLRPYHQAKADKEYENASKNVPKHISQNLLFADFPQS